MIRGLLRRFGGKGERVGGSLYTWGHATEALGKKSAGGQISKIEGEWDGKVADCFMGLKHSAFITSYICLSIS